jgi:hypothetical protein
MMALRTSREWTYSALHRVAENAALTRVCLHMVEAEQLMCSL